MKAKTVEELRKKPVEADDSPINIRDSGDWLRQMRKAKKEKKDKK